MIKEIEIKIQQELSAGKPLEEISKTLAQDALKKSDGELLRQIGHFLYHAGEFQIFFNFIEELAKNEKPVPWGPLAEALIYLTPSIPPSYIDMMLEGARVQGELDQILCLPTLEKFSNVFAEQRKDFQERLLQRVEEKKKDLTEKIHYFKNQRILQEEGKAINKYRQIFPKDSSLEPTWKDFERRHAEDLIAQMSANKKKSLHLRPPEPQLPVDVQHWLKILLKHCKKIVKTQKHAAVDFALLFYFLDLYNEAIEILAEVPATPAHQWLSLELKILARRYVDAIEEARHLEQLYADDPEATFATTYARAQCLWELGQNSLALNLLQGIVKIRPYFRSAHSLLQQWMEEQQ